MIPCQARSVAVNPDSVNRDLEGVFAGGRVQLLHPHHYKTCYLALIPPIQEAAMTEGPETIVLVVDDEPMICRSLSRMLQRYFDQVLTAMTSADADEFLDQHPVTHLITDCRLGDDLPLGIDLVPGWRRRCPTIMRAVVFSGTDLGGHEIPVEVDDVVQKGVDRDALLKALGVAR